MKYKSVIQSIPFIAIVIILFVKLLFPEFTKNQPEYLYFVLFLAFISLVSLVIYLINTKINTYRLLLLSVAIIGMLLILYSKWKQNGEGELRSDRVKSRLGLDHRSGVRVKRSKNLNVLKSSVICTN